MQQPAPTLDLFALQSLERTIARGTFCWGARDRMESHYLMPSFVLGGGMDFTCLLFQRHGCSQSCSPTLKPETPLKPALFFKKMDSVPITFPAGLPKLPPYYPPCWKSGIENSSIVSRRGRKRLVRGKPADWLWLEGHGLPHSAF